jgi:hypothetical protein
MQVRALESFVDETGRHSAGDIFPMSDEFAVIRIRSGLVVRVLEEPRTATRPEPEMAVTRRKRR